MRALSLILGVTISCAASADCADDIASLRVLEKADAERAASAAIQAGDARFLAVAGYAASVPGVDLAGCAASPANVRVIRGTTDVLCSKEHLRLQKVATDYAATYNAVVARYRAAAGRAPCDP